MGQPDRQRQPATYEDLLRAPEHVVAEILDGDLHTTPRPAPRHVAARSGLGGALHGQFDRGGGGPGGWRVSHVWLIDPVAQTNEVLRFEGGRWTIVSTGTGPDVVRAEPFDAIDLDLTVLWETP